MKSFPFFSFLSLGGLGQENIRTYDLLVIGGGSAGLTAAKFSSTFGKSVAIIEKSRMGGDCTWTGCVPSKSLLASAKCAHAVSKSAPFGVHLKGDVEIKMNVIKERIQKNIQHIYEEDDSPEALKKLGIDVINGSATFLAKKKLLVDGETLQAKDGILICTGATPIRPSIPGLQDVEYITYEEVFDLEEVPRTMTFVGGGPIACELAMAFSRLGSKVTVIASKLLPKEEPEANAAMSRVFESEGIVVTKSNLKSVEKVLNQNGHIAECENGVRISGDLLLIAVGRKPTVEGMGLENIGIQLNDTSGIQVDKNLQTSVKGVYAAGDCIGDRQFTHYAGYQGAVAARNILLPFTDPGLIDYVPATTFTDPELASIGMTEQQAKDEFGENQVSVAFKMINETDRGICEGVQEGFIKIVYKSKGYKILGATIMSPVAGELISEIASAMKTGLSFDMLATVMHTYPSHSFALQAMAAEVYYEKLVKMKGLLNFLKRIGL